MESPPYLRVAVVVLVVVCLAVPEVSSLIFPTTRPHTIGAKLFEYGPSNLETILHKPGDNECPKWWYWKMKIQDGFYINSIKPCNNGVIGLDGGFTHLPVQNSRHGNLIPVDRLPADSDSFLGVFYSDLYTEGIGTESKVRVRNSISRYSAGLTDTLKEADEIINNGFFDPNRQKETDKFRGALAFQVTWEKMKLKNDPAFLGEATFQVLIVRDIDYQTYMIGKYHRLDFSGAPNHEEAQVGFQYFGAYIQEFASLNRPLFQHMNDYLVTETNTHDSSKKGVWVFKLNTEAGDAVLQPPLRVGGSCSTTEADYCKRWVKMGECKPAPTGGHHCQCDHGSVPGLNKRTCVCPEGYTMVKHRENVFLPDAPEYTCEKSVFLSSCKGPESTNACDAPTNLECDTTEDHCKCKPNTWLSNFNPGVICYNEAQLRARGEWNGR